MPLAKMAALLRERFGLTGDARGARAGAASRGPRGRPDLRRVVRTDPRQSRREPRRDRLAGRRGAALVVGVCHAGDYGVSHLPRRAASTRRPRCWAPTLTASWCETGGRRIAASRRRCIRRVWRTWCAERAPCPRIIRAVRGRPACRRSSPTPSHSVIDGRRTRSPSTASPWPAGACSRASGDLLDTAPALPAAQRFAAHLDREFAAVFAFLWAPEVEATNWRAEHAIRPAVVNRKICGGNRTPRGAQTQQILASVIRTARQRLVDLTELFTTLLRSPRPTVPKALQAPPR